MTQRASLPATQPRPVVDFTTLTNASAIARIRALAAQGLPDETLALMFGWNRSDVRRAIAPAPSRPSQ